MVFIVLRHGESKWNKENRFTGFTDIDLNEAGIQEAKEVGYFLSNIPLYRIDATLPPGSPLTLKRNPIRFTVWTIIVILWPPVPTLPA